MSYIQTLLTPKALVLFFILFSFLSPLFCPKMNCLFLSCLSFNVWIFSWPFLVPLDGNQALYRNQALNLSTIRMLRWIILCQKSGGHCQVHYRMFGHIPSLYPLSANLPQSWPSRTSRHCQMSPTPPPLAMGTTNLDRYQVGRWHFSSGRAERGVGKDCVTLQKPS